MRHLDGGVQFAHAPQTLREYAFIADGERGALIGPRGDFVWMCAPHWDSGAVFASLIGGAGSYEISPTGRFVWGGYYEPGSLIWRSRWVTDVGIVECREALAFPGDPHRLVLLRQIHVISGDARLVVRLQPAAQFGRRHMHHVRRTDDGVWLASVGGLRMRWSGASDAAVFGEGAHQRGLATTMSLREGASRDLVFEMADTELPADPVDAATLWAQTEEAWNQAVPVFGPLAAERDAAHSYAVMRGLTTSAGAMVAAATMSLPEHADEGANYDYRYVWIRDQCYAGVAVAADGPHPLLDAAVGQVAARLLEDGPKLMPAYTTRGGVVPRQEKLDLPGYPGGYDVLGNHVRDQFQLDVFGEALLLFAAAASHDRLTGEHRRAVSVAVSAIEENLHRPDAGIWELGEKPWAHSRLICVAGLRAIAATRAGVSDIGRLSGLADRILAGVSADCLDAGGRWRRAPDDDRIDAALLLPALRGALPADDARSVATYHAVQRELSRDFYVYRFRPQHGLGTTDSAFLLCGFVMAMAALPQGDHVDAFRYFERNRTACGPAGILSEEYDITERQMRGNLPQAFVHAVMFESSSRLGRSGEPSR